MRTRNWLAPFLAVLVLASAGGSTALAQARARPVAASSETGGTVTISDETGSTWTCGFNPFNPSVDYLSQGIIYEPLVYIDTLTGQQTPWLASAWAWSNNNTTLTFTIRSGVSWSDGQPLTAADVVYTFELMKQHPGLDLNSVWSTLASVVQQGANQVVMTFTQPSVPYFYFIADDVMIVPQHIWTGIGKPVTNNDSKPVGSGPFLMQSCTPENISYVRNPNYWQPGLPHIAKVEFPAFLSNDTANSYLATDKAQWGGQFISNIKAAYLAKSNSNHYWFPPLTNNEIFINQTVPSLKVLAVRKAMAYAINRSKVAAIGEYGELPASNQTDIVRPTFSSWYDSSLAAKYNYGYHPSKAIQILKAAGYKKNSSGVFVSPGGHPLSFTMINIGDYSDWVASLQIIEQELSQVGIAVKVRNLSSTTYDTLLFDGKYQLAYGAEVPEGPSPYYELRETLYSKNSAPIGQAASSNYERWDSASTDQLLNEYGTTTDLATQHQIVDQLEAVMLSEVPTIPVTESVDFYEWSTAKLTGWPTPSDPYAQPSPYVAPDWEVVLLHLSQK
ncbi:MAG: ABC transporter substrate-binding protein [Candidatus Dormiibacterota bacterium]